MSRTGSYALDEALDELAEVAAQWAATAAWERAQREKAARQAQAAFVKNPRATLRGGLRISDLMALAQTDEQPFPLVRRKSVVARLKTEWDSAWASLEWLKFPAAVSF